MAVRTSARGRGVRLILYLGFAGALLTGFSCGGSSSSGGGGGVATPQLSCSAGALPASSVGMTCGAALDAVTEKVNVVVNGPSSGSTTVLGFNFDVTYDPAKVGFVPSASYTSPLFPNALIAVTLFNGQQGRVVVSVQQPGGLGAVTIGSGQSTVLSLSFQRAAGATFGPTPLAFENTDATAASSPVAFDSSITLAYQ